MTILLAFTAACLFGIGTYLVLQRKLSRVIIGLGLMGHGANVLLITSGRRGRAPLIGSGDPSTFADPIPQALALTAIVISFGVTGLLLALAYRSWILTDDDEIADDAEDRRVAEHGAHHDDDVGDADSLEPACEDDDPDHVASDHGPTPPAGTVAPASASASVGPEPGGAP